MVEMQKKGTRFEQRVHKTVLAHEMLAPGDSVLVGVSGGPDSVALFLALRKLAESLSLQLCIAHVNHCLRGEESDRDEVFVRELAASCGVDVYVEKIDVAAVARERKRSIEEAARDVRYDFYRSVAASRGAIRIALGHNSDDNAEQVLMNLLRGSGPRGLAGIPPVREGGIIRPLIRTTRQEILDYLKACGRSFVQDSSNQDVRFLRNRVRHELLPHLKAVYNPGVSVALNRLSAILSEEEDWMEAETLAVADTHLEWVDKNEIRLKRLFFSSAHPALARRVIRFALRGVKGDLKRISLGHIDDVLALILGRGTGKRLDLPGRIRVTFTRTWIYFTRSELPLRRLPALRR